MNILAKSGHLMIAAFAVSSFLTQKSEGAVTITLSETDTGIAARVQGSFNITDHTLLFTANFDDTAGLLVGGGEMLFDSAFSNVLSLYSYSGTTPVVTGTLAFTAGGSENSLGYFRVNNAGGLFLSSQFLGGATVDFTREFSGTFAGLGITPGQFRTFSLQNDSATIIAVPEPSSLLLLGLGSLSFLYRRRA